MAIITPSVATTSRAVLRDVQAGSMVSCTYCKEAISFRARERPKQVICNVYHDARWAGIEHFHEACYQSAGEPHGVAIDRPQRLPPSR